MLREAVRLIPRILQQPQSRVVSRQFDRLAPGLRVNQLLFFASEITIGGFTSIA